MSNEIAGDGRLMFETGLHLMNEKPYCRWHSDKRPVELCIRKQALICPVCDVPGK